MRLTSLSPMGRILLGSFLSLELLLGGAFSATAKQDPGAFNEPISIRAAWSGSFDDKPVRAVYVIDDAPAPFAAVFEVIAVPQGRRIATKHVSALNALSRDLEKAMPARTQTERRKKDEAMRLMEADREKLRIAAQKDPQGLRTAYDRFYNDLRFLYEDLSPSKKKELAQKAAPVDPRPSAVARKPLVVPPVASLRAPAQAMAAHPVTRAVYVAPPVSKAVAEPAQPRRLLQALNARVAAAAAQEQAVQNKPQKLVQAVRAKAAAEAAQARQEARAVEHQAAMQEQGKQRRLEQLAKTDLDFGRAFDFIRPPKGAQILASDAAALRSLSLVVENALEDPQISISAERKTRLQGKLSQRDALALRQRAAYEAAYADLMAAYNVLPQLAKARVLMQAQEMVKQQAKTARPVAADVPIRTAPQVAAPVQSAVLRRGFTPRRVAENQMERGVARNPRASIEFLAPTDGLVDPRRADALRFLADRVNEAVISGSTKLNPAQKSAFQKTFAASKRQNLSLSKPYRTLYLDVRQAYEALPKDAQLKIAAQLQREIEQGGLEQASPGEKALRASLESLQGRSFSTQMQQFLETLPPHQFAFLSAFPDLAVLRGTPSLAQKRQLSGLQTMLRTNLRQNIAALEGRKASARPQEALNQKTHAQLQRLLNAPIVTPSVNQEYDALLDWAGTAYLTLSPAEQKRLQRELPKVQIDSRAKAE